MHNELIKYGSQALNGTLPKKAIIYCRVSDPEQVKKGHGLHSQEAVCREYARYRGLEVEAVFHENLTGKLADRPIINDILKYLRERRKDGGRIVIIDDLNRFARGHRAHWPLKDELKAAGGVLESPKFKFGEDADSALVEGMLVTTAQYQREKGAEQTKSRMRGRVMNGYWPFYTPRGYRHLHKRGEGKVLVREEPEASIIQEALEGFASGRFQTKAEVCRFLSIHPEFSRMTNQNVQHILTRPIYAGYVGKTEWDIPLRKGKHEGLISIETFDRIQNRLMESPKAPARKDIRLDFPLRGMLACSECGKPLTSCWSTSKTGAKHAYYMCFAKPCTRRGKSIKRDAIENAFVSLLDRITPSQILTDMAHAMFKDIWAQRIEQAQSIATRCGREAKKIEKQIETVMDKLVECASGAVIERFTKRIERLERQALVLRVKADEVVVPQRSFDELFELAVAFLSSPSKLWASGRMDYQNLVLRLTFSDRLEYCPESGFRTPKTTYPFKLLEGLSAGIKEMAEGVRFELTVPLRVRRFSRPVP